MKILLTSGNAIELNEAEFDKAIFDYKNGMEFLEGDGYFVPRDGVAGFSL